MSRIILKLHFWSKYKSLIDGTLISLHFIKSNYILASTYIQYFVQLVFFWSAIVCFLELSVDRLVWLNRSFFNDPVTIDGAACTQKNIWGNANDHLTIPFCWGSVELFVGQNYIIRVDWLCTLLTSSTYKVKTSTKVHEVFKILFWWNNPSYALQSLIQQVSPKLYKFFTNYGSI